MTALTIVCFLTGLIHFSETMASSMRLAGVRTRQVASSLSFVNATLLISRMSNMFQAPLLGGMVDASVIHNNSDVLVTNFRYIIFAAFIGNLVGAIMIPTFVAVFTKGIKMFEEVGSLPKVAVMTFYPKNLASIARSIRLPSKASWKNLSLKNIPKTFLILNVLMVSIYSIGVLSSLYAGALVPAFRTTASQLSGIVNGMATILLVLMVDPTSAHITDQVVKGKRKENDVRVTVFYIVIGRIVGTLIIAQLLFLPASFYIKDVTLFVKHLFLQ